MPLYWESGVSSWSSFSGNPFIDGLLGGSQWGLGSAFGTTTITVSFPWLNGATALFGYSNEINHVTAGVTDAQRIDILRAFDAWSNVADIAFVEVAEDSAGNVGDIRVGFSEAVGDWWGWAYYPGGYPAAGDIWAHPRYAAESFAPGTYNFYAMLHEIGHAIGLDHSFDGQVAIPTGFDDRRYTVMSYTDAAGSWWYNPATGQSEYLVSGPMVYDILAIQHLYGANMSHEAGNSTYVFLEDRPFIQAIWDAGGIDWIDLSDFTNGCTIDLAPGSYSTTDFINHDVTGNLGIAFNCIIENVQGGSGDDSISGNLAANRLIGGGGNDHVFGADGNDLLEGGEGNDSLDGGSGTNRLIGGLGNDILSNGIASYETALAGVRVDVDAGIAESLEAGDLAGIGVDQLVGILTVIGSAFADQMLGGSVWSSIQGGGGDDTIIGGVGDNWIDGGAGNDRMEGGAGNDRFTIDSLDDMVIELAGAGFDTVLAAFSLDLSLFANIEALELIGTASISGTGDHRANSLTGNSGENRLTGGAGNDLLDGGTGEDVMYGGTGNDSFVVDHASDATVELSGEGTDEALASRAYTLRDNVENLTQTGIYSIHGTGNELANVLTGNSGSNRLFGVDGDDRLIGNEGSDILDGGAGLDKMFGGAGNDIYIIDSTTDQLVEYAGEGRDTVRTSVTRTLGADFEWLEMTGSADIRVTGNDFANVLKGNAGNNIFYGRAGNDKIYARDGADVVSGEEGNDWLEGGAGRDRFYGGTGSDRFVFRDGDFSGVTSSTADQIHDFGHAEGDRIRLDLVDADATLDGKQDFALIGTTSFSGAAGELRYEQISGHTYVQGDTNGDGVADFWIRLDGLHVPGADDFIL